MALGRALFNIRHVRTRARRPPVRDSRRSLDEKRGERVKGLASKTPTKEKDGSENPAKVDTKEGQARKKFGLRGNVKHELGVLEDFRLLMRETGMKAEEKALPTTEPMTVDKVIALMDVKPKQRGYHRVASLLKSVYSGRDYKEVDRDLKTVTPLKRGKHPRSEILEEILSRLGFLNQSKSVRAISATSDRKTSSSAGKKSATKKKPSLLKISKVSSAGPPVPEQQSITLETPPNFLDLRPQSLLVADGAEQDDVRHQTPERFVIRRYRALKTSKSPRLAKQDRIADMRGGPVQVASADKFPLIPFPMETSEVPRLSHDLSRVLFNPGVYQLQDPRSRVWNFDPYLGNLMPVSEFNYDALNRYITSSEDVNLRTVAQAKDKRYIGSTSSMSGVLAHFHFLLSGFRDLNLDHLSRGFKDEGQVNFTRIQKGPTAIFLRYKDGVYAVDADKEFDSANILMSLGRSMEKLLTSDKEEFERYRRTEDATKDAQMKSSHPEAYHYSGLGQFLLRSQLDAHDPRLPGTGMFDLKTRAVAAVRMMVHDHEKGAGYQIKERFGTWESYEREYFDMMRSAFLKYSLQVRMGRMDGIFVAYHNTERLFGFQYVPLPELDFALHGQEDRTLGDQEFSLSIQLLDYIFNEATMQHPGQSFRFHFEAREATEVSPHYMYVFAEPVTEEEIVAIQSLKKDEIRAFEDRIFNPGRAKSPKLDEDDADEAEDGNESDEVDSAPSDSSTNTGFAQQSNAADVAFLDGVLGLNINEAMASEPKEAPVPECTEEHAAGGPEASTTDTQSASASSKPLLAWRLNIRNIVNGLPVMRPENLKESDTWSLQYTLVPLSPGEAERHYTLCKNRRKNALEAPQETDAAANFYLNRLVSMSRSGAQWRQHLDKLDAGRERIVLYGE
ncbi:hypothetical protein G647_04853 [Cladophialophora carrionii CBS 160.54]|uniref:Uncharacterized protein n=1 Tax=Cladophialophora carrionii CBS 160.54 TaxID=1279043 RepID=V9DAQ8_9EURO|nr:uncharacterized protein G647_04853 [Cladophialophora carrionii CBS 160.54]ETI23057.1 hypothetical protein G647_04853 [Cladophialophora carrionii CBS 160.54]